MATFNVFVEGPVDDSPTALPELAEAMSQRYGLPAAELVSRLKRGRFRVKSNLDAETAERYRRDLMSIGARVLVEDSSISPTATPVAGTPVMTPTGLAAGAQRPSTPAATIMGGRPQTRTPAAGVVATEPQPSTPAATIMGGRPLTRTPAAGVVVTGPQPSTPAATIMGGGPQSRTPASGVPSTGPQHPRPSTPPPTGPQPPTRPTPPPSALAGYARPSTPPPMGPEYPRPATPIPSDMVSGLSAGFGDAAQSDLGALGDMGALSLASLDGEEAPASSGQFDAAPPPPPPEPEAPVVKITSKPKAKEARKKPGPSKAMDLFAPPDAGDQDLKVDLATEEVEERARKKASVPPENVTTTPSSSTPAMRRSTPAAMTAVDASVGTVRPRQFSRNHFLAAIVIGLVVGFVPAHVVASMREKSAFAEIDAKVSAAHDSADSIETYVALDAAREKLRDEKQSKRTMIALTSMLMWAVIGAGVAFAFLRFGQPRAKA